MTQTSSRRTVVFAGGGTGGHLFPGIAVAEELLRRESNTRVIFVGSEKPLERDILSRAGFEHVPLTSVSPSLLPTRIGSSLARNWRAFRQAQSLIAREQPSVVIGLGGFASVPPVLAARRAGVPIVLLEQNVVPGKATRWLSRFAAHVCVPWDEAADRLRAKVKTLVTGNPIRREIAQLASETRSNSEGSEVRTLLILGGSQGATSLNATVLEACSALRVDLAGWQILHQTGAADADAIRQRYLDLSLTADVQPFLADMAEQYRRATVVISRAGATTLAELACAGLPAILVPLATSAHDHQRLNAQMFADRSAAQLVEQTADGTAAKLRDTLAVLLNDAAQRKRLSNNIRQLARPDAAVAVVVSLSFR